MGSRNPSMECVVNTEPALSFLQFTFIQYLTFCYCALNKIRFKLWNSVQHFCQKVVERELNPMIHLFYEVHERHDVLFNGHSLW